MSGSTLIQKIVTILLILICLFCLSLPYLAPIEPVDDTYIVLRYAEHLSKGYGLRWNIGEDPVEGYTSFLHVMLLTVFSLPFSDGALAASVVSYLCLAILLFTIFYLARYELCLSSLGALICVIAMLFDYNVFITARRAMETTLATLCLICTVLFFLKYKRDSENKHLYGLFSFAFLTILSRPELIVPSFFLIGTSVSPLNLNRSKQRLLSIILFILIGLIYFIWRYEYFGYFFPNTFYVKNSLSIISELGLENVFGFIKDYHLIIILTILSLIIIRNRRRELIVVIILSLLGIFVFAKFHTIMNFNHRYFIPFLPNFLIVTICGLEELWTRIHRKLGEGKGILIFSIILLIIVGYPKGKPSYKFSEIFLKTEMGESMLNCHIKIGKCLKNSVHRINDYLAVSEAGAIPFYSEWVTIDTNGLNDKYLAHYGKVVVHDFLKITGRVDVDYVYKKKPVVIIMSSSNPDRVEHYVGRPLFHSPYLRSEYDFAEKFIFTPTWYQFVFVRKDCPYRMNILKNLRNCANENHLWALQKYGAMMIKESKLIND